MTQRPGNASDYGWQIDQDTLDADDDAIAQASTDNYPPVAVMPKEYSHGCL